jgi:hypothetical protein
MRSDDGLCTERLSALHREAVELAEEFAAGQGGADARFAGGDPAGAARLARRPTAVEGDRVADQRADKCRLSGF